MRSPGATRLATAGLPAGAIKPFVVLALRPRRRSTRSRSECAVVEGIAGATAPAAWRKDGLALVEAIPTADGSSKAMRAARSRERRTSLGPAGVDARRRRAGGPRLRARGLRQLPVRAAASCVLLTYMLLARAFRSLLLPLKAVILNLVSLGAAYGIIVFIFQQGHGSEAIWGVHGDAVDHPVDPADDLRVPVRALDGLRGLHAHAHARGLRRDRRHDRRRSRSASRARASS